MDMSGKWGLAVQSTKKRPPYKKRIKLDQTD